MAASSNYGGGHADSNNSHGVSAGRQNAFKVLVKDIANNLSSEDLEKLSFFCGVSLGEGEKRPKSALDLLWDMLRKGKFSHTSPEGMEKLLRDIDRCDLITTHLDPFKEKYIITREVTGFSATGTHGATTTGMSNVW